MKISQALEKIREPPNWDGRVFCGIQVREALLSPYRTSRRLLAANCAPGISFPSSSASLIAALLITGVYDTNSGGIAASSVISTCGGFFLTLKENSSPSTLLIPMSSICW